MKNVHEILPEDLDGAIEEMRQDLIAQHGIDGETTPKIEKYLKVQRSRLEGHAYANSREKTSRKK